MSSSKPLKTLIIASISGYAAYGDDDGDDLFNNVSSSMSKQMH